MLKDVLDFELSMPIDTLEICGHILSINPTKGVGCAGSACSGTCV